MRRLATPALAFFCAAARSTPPPPIAMATSPRGFGFADGIVDSIQKSVTAQVMAHRAEIDGAIREIVRDEMDKCWQKHCSELISKLSGVTAAAAAAKPQDSDPSQPAALARNKDASTQT